VSNRRCLVGDLRDSHGPEEPSPIFDPPPAYWNGAAVSTRLADIINVQEAACPPAPAGNCCMSSELPG